MKYLYIVIICLTLISCKQIEEIKQAVYDSLQGEYQQESVVYESPEGRIKIIYYWNDDEDRLFYWYLYQNDIDNFKNAIWDTYDKKFNNDGPVRIIRKN